MADHCQVPEREQVEFEEYREGIVNRTVWIGGVTFLNHTPLLHSHSTPRFAWLVLFSYSG